jgi:hypothetical protein
MTTKKFQKVIKPRNLIAMDLRTSKYHMRVVQSEKVFKRTKQKQELRKELVYG